MDGWTIAWLVWGALFLLIEGLALVKSRHQEGTLSDNVWRWFGVRSRHWTAWVIVRRLVLALLLVVLTLHLTLAWP